jgi:predicted small integral membrane protein
MTLDWMYWTLPTAIFFISLFVVLTAMGIWQTISPSEPRRGFLPLATTPGDRLFIGIISTIFIHLAWIGFTDLSLWIMFPIGVGWLIVVMIWG